MTSPDNDLFRRVEQARKDSVKTTQSFYCLPAVTAKMTEYATANRIPNGALVDMAFIEFLEKRGVTVGEVPELGGEEVPAV